MSAEGRNTNHMPCPPVAVRAPPSSPPHLCRTQHARLGPAPRRPAPQFHAPPPRVDRAACQLDPRRQWVGRAGGRRAGSSVSPRMLCPARAQCSCPLLLTSPPTPRPPQVPAAVQGAKSECIGSAIACEEAGRAAGGVVLARERPCVVEESCLLLHVCVSVALERTKKGARPLSLETHTTRAPLPFARPQSPSQPPRR